MKNLLNNSLYVQIWGEQVHREPDPKASKLSTKEFFEKEQQTFGDNNAIAGGVESRVCLL